MKVSLVSMLMATTFLSTNVAAYEIEPTIEGGAVSYVEGTAEDYNFTVQELNDEGNLVTKYYKINLDKDKFTPSSNIGWIASANGFPNTIEVHLPNNKTQYFQYITATPGNYVDASRIEDTSTLTADDLAGKVFRNLTSSSDGGAIFNDKQHQALIIPNDFINNSADGNGGAIYNKYHIGGISGNFIENTSTDGGAIYNNPEGTIDNIGGNFVNNHVTDDDTDETWGGALSNDGIVGDISANFIGNYANSAETAHGGAISNYSGSRHGEINSITGKFIANYADGDDAQGGGIYNSGSIEYITGDFIGNYAEGNTFSRGGAIHNEGYINSSIEGDFIGNYAESGISAHGGAVYNAGYILDITGNFIGNYTSATESYGGAIINDNENDGAYIGRITGDFINNYASAPNDSGFARGGAIYNDDFSSNSIYYSNFIGNYATSMGTAEGGAIYNNEQFGGSIFGDFIGNYTYGENQGSRGGAIYTSNGSINKIEGNFINNYATGINGGAEGGALYTTNNSGVNSIIGNFIGNYVKPPYDEIQTNMVKGGAIANYGNIEEIEGNFSDNYAESTDGIALGGAVYNYDASMESITGNFSNNYATAGTEAFGGAIYNTSGGNVGTLSINNITGDFINNYASAQNDRGFARGGAIYNDNRTIEKITGSFIGNYAVATGGAANGGAIYSNTDITLSAKENGTSVIKDNYIEDATGRKSEAIYMDNSTATLTLEANNNGTIEIHDIIDGMQGYKVNLTGDGTGSVSLFNDVNNADITANNVAVNLSNGEIKDYTFNSLTTDDTVNWSIDVDLDNQKADTITSTTTNSSGIVYIDRINNFGYNDDGVIIQILHNYDNSNGLQLALNGDNFIVQNEDFVIEDNVQLSKTYIKEWGVTITTTETENDSIKIESGAIFDSLALLNAKETAEDRSFVFDTSGTYSLSENLSPTTAGTLNIIGFNNGNEASTVNASGNSLFDLSNATTLNISNVTLSNAAGDAITASDQAEVNLTNVSFENNGGNAITSSGNVNINVKDTDIAMSENIVMDNAKLTLYAENGTLDLSNEISGNDYNLHLKGGNIKVNNSVSGVNNFEMSSSAILHLGKESNISVANIMHAQDTAPVGLQSNSSPTLEFDIDIVNNHITNGTIDVSGDVSGTYNVIINALSTEYTQNSSVFLTALNDDSSTASDFSVLRVEGSPYMWKTILNAEGETVGSTWYLAMEQQANPDNPVVNGVATPEVIAAIGLHSAGIEQTRSVVHNVANKTSIQSANKRKRVYKQPTRNQWGWTIVDKKGHLEDSARDGVWVSAQSEYANIDTPVDMEAQIWGIEGGFNLQSNANNTLGIFASYRNGTYDLSGAGAEFNAKLTSEIGIDSYLGGLYYRYDNSKFYAFATLYGGMQQAEITTEDSVASFETDGMEFGASAEIGYSFALSRTATLTPSLGVFYSQVSFDEAEDNVGKTYEWDDVSNIEAELGLNFAQNIGRSKVYVKPSVIQTFVNGNEVMITGLEAVETADNQTLGRIEIGGRLGITDNLYGFGWANYTFSSDYNSASLGAGLNYSW